MYIIRPKSGTEHQWQSVNPILKEREIGYEYPTGGVGKGIVKMKMGDGVTRWNDLPYAQVEPLTIEDIVSIESSATDKVPSAKYVKEKFKNIDDNVVRFPHYGSIIGTYTNSFTAPKNCWAKVSMKSGWTNATLSVNDNGVLVQQIENTNAYPVKTTTWIPLKAGDSVSMSSSSSTNAIEVVLYNMR